MKLSAIVQAGAVLAIVFMTGAGFQTLHPQTQNGIAYVSGGVGEDEEEAMRAMTKDHNLRLSFAVRGSGAYLADVRVLVRDAKGMTLLDAVSDGPCFFATLPAGRYQVSASSAGVALTKQASVSAKRGANLYFYWTDGDQTSQQDAPSTPAGIAEPPEETRSGHGIHGCW